ncbi:MAG: hypothetical protein IPJ61_21100 [Tessaracoccus sp.]|uniref:hypothetical protein n=1 Tax=Tessaracoccus sp. TaxID=1971211 RepID=UPI001ED6A57C|nr:hypothetical protein [Tessaracoccus sp.]MBK7823487.1 hypothetical protein [Tessaracoccus sp.]
MPTEPSTKRTVVFIDGQKPLLRRQAGLRLNFPNYDVPALAAALCQRAGWTLAGTYFSTGIPSAQDHPGWNHFWSAKLAVMGTRGVVTFARQLKYRNQTVALPGGATTTVLVGQEKGVDVRLARHRPPGARGGLRRRARPVAGSGPLGGGRRGAPDLDRSAALDQGRLGISDEPDLPGTGAA